MMLGDEYDWINNKGNSDSDNESNSDSDSDSDIHDR